MGIDMISLAFEVGAFGAAVTAVDTVVFRPEFRKICEDNACGQYGRRWTCPPEIGEIDALIDQAKSFRSVLVYQSVHPIHSSFDIKGMLQAGERHGELARSLRRRIQRVLNPILCLGAGGCNACKRCAKEVAAPCRHPDEAMASLEGYGIDVTGLAAQCGLAYNNGPGTVTYFGAVLFGQHTQ